MGIVDEIREIALNVRLKRVARELGACDKYLGRWNVMKGLDGTLDLFRLPAPQEFCMRHHWPTNETLLELAGAERLERHGIFVDSVAVLNEPAGGFYVLLGDSRVTLVPKPYGVYHFLIRDNSTLVIEGGSDSARVITDTVDNGRVLQDD